MLRHIATSLIATFWLLGSTASSAFTIFHSPDDDGVNPGIALLLPGQNFTLNLWFDPGALCFDYSAFFESDFGLDLKTFTGGATVIANTDGFPRRLAVTGGDISAGQDGPTRIGTLTGTAGNVPGAQLLFVSGTFSDANLKSVIIDGLPQVVAKVGSVPVECGDKTVESPETCDDGNTRPGDGCSRVCEVESGWHCSGAPSACTAICGDRLVRSGEQCDDGNTSSGDGCSATCEREGSALSCGTCYRERGDCGRGARMEGAACNESCAQGFRSASGWCRVLPRDQILDCVRAALGAWTGCRGACQVSQREDLAVCPTRFNSCRAMCEW